MTDAHPGPIGRHRRAQRGEVHASLLDLGPCAPAD